MGTVGSGPAPRGPLGGERSWVHWSFGKDPPPRPAACRAQTQEKAPGTGPRGVHPARLGASGGRGTAPGPPCPRCSALGVSLTENSLEAWPQATALGRSWSLETTGFAVSPSFFCSCSPETAAPSPWGACSSHLLRGLPPLSPADARPPSLHLAREHGLFSAFALKTCSNTPALCLTGWYRAPRLTLPVSDFSSVLS